MVTAPQYIASRRQMLLARRRIASLFERVDVLVTPTTMASPGRIDAALAGAPPEFNMIRNTLPFNAYGLPTISVPCGFTSAGLADRFADHGTATRRSACARACARVRASDRVASARAAARMTESAWTCPTCRAAVVTRYCPNCGERPLEQHELTLRGLATQIFNALTSVDGRLLRTFVQLMRRPGDLTVAYLDGQRKPYIGPVPLYLMANVLFFAAESLFGAHVFSTSLDYHLSNQPWSPLAQTLVARHLESAGTTLAAYTPVFDQALSLHARSLIILMALLFAVFPWLVFRRRRKPFVAHAVFSLHLYSFLLLLLCVADAIPALDARLREGGIWGRVLDNAMAAGLLLACAVYMYVASRKVYGAQSVARAAQVALLTVGVGAVVFGYRFGLFVLTLYTT